MFDTVSVVNLNQNFKHNGVAFQTKSLDCDASEYIIFNGQLWHQYNGQTMESYSEALPVPFTGSLNIYADYTSGDRTYWVEYDIELVSGRVTTVEVVANRLTADRSDKSQLRPLPLSASACLTIDFRGVSGPVYEAFHANLDGKLNTLRELLGDPKAEIIYQVRSPTTGLDIYGSPTRWLHSVVQDLSDFKKTQSLLHDSGGNPFPIFVDEASSYLA